VVLGRPEEGPLPAPRGMGNIVCYGPCSRLKVASGRGINGTADPRTWDLIVRARHSRDVLVPSSQLS
jgi:hypothetical protein